MAGRGPQPGQGAPQSLPDEDFADIAGVVAALQIPKGQRAVQQSQGGQIGRQLGYGISQAFHFPHRAERAQQGAGYGGFSAGIIGTGLAIGRAQVEVSIAGGEGRLAEQAAVGPASVGDGAAAEVNQIAAQGQMAVNINVRAVHRYRRPVGGGVIRRGYAAQQPLRAGAGKEEGPASGGGSAVGGFGWREGLRPCDDVGETLPAAAGGQGHAAHRRLQLPRRFAKVQRHNDARGVFSGPARSGRRQFGDGHGAAGYGVNADVAVPEQFHADKRGTFHIDDFNLDETVMPQDICGVQVKLAGRAVGQNNVNDVTVAWQIETDNSVQRERDVLGEAGINDEIDVLDYTIAVLYGERNVRLQEIVADAVNQAVVHYCVASALRVMRSGLRIRPT